jgi:hypothetical protein
MTQHQQGLLYYSVLKTFIFIQEMNSMNMFNQSQEMPEFSDMLTNWFSSGPGTKKKPVKTVAKKTPTGRRR